MTDQSSPRRVIKAGSHAGKGIAVFTSGGDSQGTDQNVGMKRLFSQPLSMVVATISDFFFKNAKSTTFIDGNPPKLSFWFLCH